MISQQFLIVAGEASGDMYGAEVARSLFRKFPGCRIYGLGGAADARVPVFNSKATSAKPPSSDRSK